MSLPPFMSSFPITNVGLLLLWIHGKVNYSFFLPLSLSVFRKPLFATVRMSKGVYLFVILSCIIITYPELIIMAATPPIDLFLWVNAAQGIDNSTCGTQESPCGSLRFAVNQAYDTANVSYAQISLQTSTANEEIDIHAGESAVVIVCKESLRTSF
jgi:hypothetical protein